MNDDTAWWKSILAVLMFAFAQFSMGIVLIIACLGGVATVIAPKMRDIMNSPPSLQPSTQGYPVPGAQLEPEVMELMRQSQQHAERLQQEARRRQAEVEAWQRTVEEGREPALPPTSTQPGAPVKPRPRMVPKKRTPSPEPK